MDAHRITWYGVVSPTERVRRTRIMNGRDWGWDAVCSCGWETRTGGEIQERIRERVADHKYDAAHPSRPLTDDEVRAMFRVVDETRAKESER